MEAGTKSHLYKKKDKALEKNVQADILSLKEKGLTDERIKELRYNIKVVAKTIVSSHFREHYE